MNTLLLPTYVLILPAVNPSLQQLFCGGIILF